MEGRWAASGIPASSTAEGLTRLEHGCGVTAAASTFRAMSTPAAIQARAGHADFSTTQLYIDLAGVAFREDAEQAEARILGARLDPGFGYRFA